jgi:hypothetical protein
MRTQICLASGVFAVALLAGCSSSEGPASAATSMADSCIRPAEITRQTIVSDQEIQFEMRNGERWVNKLPHSCPSLKFEQAFSWDVRGNMACSNQQTIRVKDIGTTCLLGEFSRMPAAETAP